jgi:hypothetical protein
MAAWHQTRLRLQHAPSCTGPGGALLRPAGHGAARRDQGPAGRVYRGAQGAGRRTAARQVRLGSAPRAGRGQAHAWPCACRLAQQQGPPTAVAPPPPSPRVLCCAGSCRRCGCRSSRWRRRRSGCASAWTRRRHRQQVCVCVCACVHVCMCACVRGGHLVLCVQRVWLCGATAHQLSLRGSGCCACCVMPCRPAGRGQLPRRVRGAAAGARPGGVHQPAAHGEPATPCTRVCVCVCGCACVWVPAGT